MRLLHRRGQGLFSCTAGASVTDFDMIGAALSELLNALSGAMALAFQGAVADVTNPADVVVIALEAMGADGEDLHARPGRCGPGCIAGGESGDARWRMQGQSCPRHEASRHGCPNQSFN